MAEKQIVLTLENKTLSHNGRGVVEALAPRERFYDIKRGEGSLSDTKRDVVRALPQMWRSDLSEVWGSLTKERPFIGRKWSHTSSGMERSMKLVIQFLAAR